MSFDKETRNLLAKTVTACRRRLIEDVDGRLRGLYGIQPDGTVLPLEKMTHLSPDQTAAARMLRDLFDHHAVGGAGEEYDRRKAAYERMVLEISFTILNRLAALRLCEERGLVQECVRKGMSSDGFLMFERISGGALGPRYDAYQVFLESMFDELALDLGVLFDRTTPQSAVFPTERCMEDVLTEFNKPDLTHLWTEDETIGWIYQYFNPTEERKAMREASQAPRNSRELAVRNQFFTPRYVVNFLTDNTLGRIWYEMRKGETILKEECRYLVRSPNEIFLAPGEKASPEPEKEVDLSQEGLLKNPVFIEYRSKKDPRDLRILDPACGSGHFLLYAFDLLERIYEEAWADPESPKSETTGRTLGEEHETIDEMRRAAPRLIIELNLHGIDIDPRAVQIAALALWLRAQKTWKNLGLKAGERPQIKKTNIVTAEPMPGEEDMRREFTAGLKPRVLGQIIDEIFEKMKLAGEAGSLLRIEEDIKEAVAAAGRQWREGSKTEQQLLFPGMGNPHPMQQEPRFDLQGITDERFWEQAEDRILEAMKTYAEQAENGLAVRRRLFAEDASRGFAFIDLCRKRYDVALMNPPFGSSTQETYRWLKAMYSDSFIDLLAAFVQRALGLVRIEGMVGAITSRACLYTITLEDWRRRLVIPNLELLADLGDSVLDDAVVRTCAAIYGARQSRPETIVFLDVRFQSDKAASLREAKLFMQQSTLPSNCYIHPKKRFIRLSAARLLYNLPNTYVSWLESGPSLVALGGSARAGLTTYDDFRFLRLLSEVPGCEIGTTWIPISKGGYFETFYTDIHLAVNMKDEGKEVGEYNRALYDTDAQSRRASSFYNMPAITYLRRTTKGFCPRALPKNCVFADKGPVILPPEGYSVVDCLGYFASSTIRAIVDLQSHAGSYETGILNSIPLAVPANSGGAFVGSEVSSIWREKYQAYSFLESSHNFTLLPVVARQTLREGLREIHETVHRFNRDLLANAAKVDAKVLGLLGFSSTDFDGYEVSVEDHLLQIENRLSEPAQLTAELSAFIVGIIFGRWDVRFALDPSFAPHPPDPFDPLPVCPPGMLVGPDGLPAELNRIVSEEWLRARSNANILPPEGSVKVPTITDAEYPLRISWDGIMVDDPGFNSNQPSRDDIVRRIREVFDLLWKDKANEIEQEACGILDVSDLREYFRKPTGFFQDHLKRYSKSRRNSPIYWPLSTASGSYTIWIYYHRLSDQIIYTAVNKYLEPKIDEVERGIAGIEIDLKSSSGRDAIRFNDRLNDARSFLGELQDLRSELLRIAALPYKPDLNDGVIINAAPFYKLFRLRSWADDTEECWKKLTKGEYDWAHLAYTIWPERVWEVCKKDRSIAIAHGLEEVHISKESAEKKKAGKGHRKKETAR
jgi:hypothetical protein